MRMYIVRSIYYVQSGHQQTALALVEDALREGIVPDTKSSRILSDFTGVSYRLIFEEGYDVLADFEDAINMEHQHPAWRKWMDKFNMHVVKSQREILKLIG